MADEEQPNEQTSNRGSTKWRVNRKLLPLKMFFFFFYGAVGVVIPFITVYLKYLHLTASETGVITGLSVLFAMFMRSVIGMAADKLSARKTALLVCCLGFGVSFFSLWFVPQRPRPNKFIMNVTTINNSMIIHHQHHKQSYFWSCFLEDGTEICRYPKDPDHVVCGILENDKDTIRGAISEPQVEFVNDTERTGQLYSVTKSSKFHGGGDEFNLIPISEGDLSTQEYIDNNVEVPDTGQVLPLDNVDIAQPCLYIDSEEHKTLTQTNSFVDYPLAETSMTAIGGNLGPLVPDRAGSGSRPFRSTGPAGPGASAKSKNKIQCLPNCIRLPVDGDDRASFNTSYQQSTKDVMPRSIKGKGSEGDIYHSLSPDFVFLLSLLLITTARSFYSASTSLADAVTYTILGPFSFKWGQQRLWGTIGTAVAVLPVTITNDKKGDTFTGLFFACLGLTLLATFVGAWKLRADRVPKNNSFFKDLRQLLCSGSVRLFLCKLMFYGMMCGTAQNFFFWFLVDLGSSQTTLGICLLVYCISSVIILRYASRVLQRVGQANVMHLVLGCYVLRFLVISFLTTAWWVLPVEILHGVTYSLFWAAASSTASIAAPSGTQATCQAIAGAMYWDLGRGLGTLITGQILEVFGARWTFRSYSIACAALLPVFWALDRKWPLRRKPVGDGVVVKEKDQDKQAGEQLLKYAEIHNGQLLNNNNLKDTNDNLAVKTTDLSNKSRPSTDAEVQIANSKEAGMSSVETAYTVTDETDSRGKDKKDSHQTSPSSSRGDDPTSGSGTSDVGVSPRSNERGANGSDGTVKAVEFDLKLGGDEAGENSDTRSLEEWAEKFVLTLGDSSASLKFLDLDDSISTSSSEIGYKIAKLRPKSDSLIPTFRFSTSTGASQDEDNNDGDKNEDNNNNASGSNSHLECAPLSANTNDNNNIEKETTQSVDSGGSFDIVTSKLQGEEINKEKEILITEL